MEWVLGIDPPNGVAAWSEGGPVAAFAASKKHSVANARVVCDWVDELVEEHGPPAAVAIERPYGVRDATYLQSVLTNAHAAGYIHHHVEKHCEDIWRPTAPTWRKPVGIPQQPRTLVKKIAKGLACKAWREVHGTELLLPADHGHEAMCIAMSCWLERYGTGAVVRWRGTGRFA